MKEEVSSGQSLGEGVKLIFDQKAPSGRSSSCSSSSDSSFSSSRGTRTSRESGHHRRSPSSSSSESDSSSRSRSRSHPRCHRASGRSRCRHHSPPRRYRARSRSYSLSPERSSRHRRYHRRSRSRGRSPSPNGYYRRSRRTSSRSRSRSPAYWRGRRFVGRYRCRFSPSPVRSRAYRSRSRNQERSAVRLSLEEKKCLLNVAKANAARILGVQNLELPASLREQEDEEKRSSSVKEEGIDPAPQKTSAQVNIVTHDDEEGTSQTSPKTKPITFSINNAVAKPSNSPPLSASKVTSRADSVADRRPYGQWVPIRKSSKYNKH